MKSRIILNFLTCCFLLASLIIVLCLANSILSIKQEQNKAAELELAQMEARIKSFDSVNEAEKIQEDVTKVTAMFLAKLFKNCPQPICDTMADEIWDLASNVDLYHESVLEECIGYRLDNNISFKWIKKYKW